jgi:hypothetical protein
MVQPPYLTRESLQNKKAELPKDPSFGSSAIFLLEDPSLSVPSLQKVWLYRVT